MGLVYRWRILGLFSAQILLALMITGLDIEYQAAHASTTDLDFVFEIGVFGRIVLINTVLLPMAVGVMVWKRRTAMDKRPTDDLV